MSMILSRLHGCLPITSIQCEFSKVVGYFVLYYHEAGRLISCNCGNGIKTETQVFSNHSIQGIKLEKDYILVYGEKSVTILKWVHTDSNSSSQGRKVQLVTVEAFTNLDDQILDVTFLTDGRLVIGYAHNFIGIFDLSKRSLDRKVERHIVLCSTVVSLFSMLLSANDDGSLTVYAGTSLRKLIAWVGVSSNSVAGNVKHVFTDHEGVIFRIAHSQDRSRIASVSDDRSVRVWCLHTNRQLYCAWGHTARVWDVTFVLGDNGLIATSSQDGTVRVWRVGDGCLSILRGHQLHVWRVIAVDYSREGDIRRTQLISCGNDGAVNSWNLVEHLISSPARGDSTSLLVDVPESPLNRVHLPKLPSNLEVVGQDETAPLSPSTSRYGPCSVHCDAASGFSVLLMVDGTLWLADLRQLQRNPLAPADLPSSGWRYIHTLDQPCENSIIEFSPGLASWSGAGASAASDDAGIDRRPILQALYFALLSHILTQVLLMLL